VTVNMTLAWVVFAISVGFIASCMIADLYAPLRVKIAVVAPWAYFVANSPVFDAVTRS
jgi:hypothetical protein